MRLDACVGFVGLGSLGRHLAASLLAGGFPLIVHDRDAGRRRRARRRRREHGRLAARPLAEAADCVITCLPSPAAVRAVVAGADGCSPRACAAAGRGST